MTELRHIIAWAVLAELSGGRKLRTKSEGVVSYRTHRKYLILNVLRSRQTADFDLIGATFWTPARPTETTIGHMKSIFSWQLFVVIVAGWINRHRQDVIDYLVEENRVLKGQLKGKRPRFTKLFRDFLSDAGTKIIRLPIRSPNLNAYAERFVLSVKSVV